jgi:peptidoglycan/xylan/chitin deacetylase (PgdA/CDA1 family)
MPRAAFTIDVDRDVNEPRLGQLEGGSRSCPYPRFSSTLSGLQALVELLNELNISATFFLEGEVVERCGEEEGMKELLKGHEIASHSFSHEDLTGESTGVYLSSEWIDAIVGRSLATIEDVLGRRPSGFRAPYQHIDERVMSVLARRGILYDSTLFADVPKAQAYKVSDELIEIPLTRGKGLDGRSMQSYLWPLHEGKRKPADYFHLLSQQSDGFLVLADHSWHITESLEGLRTEKEAQYELLQVRAVIEGMIDRGVEFMTLEEYVCPGSEW